MSEDSSKGTLIFRLTVPGRMPLLNQCFKLDHWGRAKLKTEIQDAILSVLSAYVKGWVIPTRSCPSGTWMQSVTSQSFPTIQQNFLNSRSRKGSVPKAKKRKSR